MTEAPNLPVPTAVEQKKIHGSRWVKGQSGNPAGRPKQSLVALQRDLEGAIRDFLSADKVKRLVTAVYDRAVAGDVKAAKLILDKLIPNATDADDAGETGRVVVFKIENATFAAQQQKQLTVRQNDDIPPIDVQVVEVSKESNGK